MNNNENSYSVLGASFMIGFFILCLIWVLSGIIAFIYSIYCFGRTGDTLEKIVGLLLAIFFGPLYFIFFYFNKGYCKRKNNT
jgi:hypothetical protein